MELDRISVAQQELIKVVKNDIEAFMLHPLEKFSEIHSGVMSSTSIDSQGDQMTLEDLENIRQGIHQSPLFLQLSHDDWNPPIGRVLTASIVEENAICYLIGIFGFWDRSSYIEIDSFSEEGDGLSNISWDLIPEMPVSTIFYDRHLISKDLIISILEKAPIQVDRTPNIIQQKSEEATTVIVGLSLAMPFSMALGAYLKGLSQQLGKSNAETLIAWCRWVREDLFPRLIGDDPITFYLEAIDANCKISYIAPRGSYKMIETAFQSLGDATISSTHLLNHLIRSGYEPIHICYKYDASDKCWRPNHVVTLNAGVLCDKKVLVALQLIGSIDLTALSISRTISQDLFEQQSVNQMD
jgi:hypothetical protein